MSFELTIILLIVTGLISSLINKVMEARRGRELEEEDLDLPPLGGPDVDPSEDDVFPEPQPFGEPPAGREFREVRGTRPVSEAPTGKEFREIRGARPVDEPPGGIEFREVRGARPVSEEYDGVEFREVDFDRPDEGRPGAAESGGPPVERPRGGSEPAAEAPADDVMEDVPLVPAPRRRARRRRIQLDFKPQTVRKAIIYHEILGPPVADRRP